MTAPTETAESPPPVAALEGVATTIAGELLRNAAEGGSVEVSLDDAREEIRLVVSEHAHTIAGMGIGALFDVLEARTGEGFDPDAFRTVVEGMTDQQLAADAEADTALGKRILAQQDERRRLLESLAAVSGVAVRGVLGAAMAVQLGKLAGTV